MSEAVAAPTPGGGGPAAATIVSGAPPASGNLTPTMAAPAEPTVAPVAPPVQQTQVPGVPPSQPQWTQNMTADQQNYVNTKGFADPTSLLDSYINLEKLRGVPHERLLKLPESLDAPEMGEVFEKLGKPKEAKDYGFELKEGGNKEMLDWAQNTFHELNLTKDQATKLLDKFNSFSEDTQAVSVQRQGEQNVAQERELKTRWGAAYDQNVGQAQNAARALGLQADDINALEKSWGYAKTVQFMQSIGSRLGEGQYISGKADGFSGAMTPDQAKAQIKAKMTDKDFSGKYLSGGVKEKEEMSRLHLMASGQKV